MEAGLSACRQRLFRYALKKPGGLLVPNRAGNITIAAHNEALTPDDGDMVGYSDASCQQEKSGLPTDCSGEWEEGLRRFVGIGNMQRSDDGFLVLEGETIPEIEYCDLVRSIYQLTGWWAARRQVSTE